MKFNIRQLRADATKLLAEQQPQASKVVGTYALIIAGLSLILNFLNLYLTDTADNMIALSQVGTRSGLMALSLLLALLSSFLFILLSGGHSGAALDIVRGQTPDTKRLTWVFPHSLKVLLCMLRMMLWTMLFTYVATMVISTVMSAQLLNSIGPDGLESLTEADLMPFVSKTMTAVMIAVSLCYAFLAYRRRLYFFLLADRPDIPGGLMPKLSVMLLKGSFLEFLKIDLSYWWFYLLMGLSYGITFLPAILPAQFPISQSVLVLLTSTIHVCATGALLYWGKNRIWVTYALAYDQLITQRRDRIHQAQQARQAQPPQESQGPQV